MYLSDIAGEIDWIIDKPAGRSGCSAERTVNSRVLSEYGNLTKKRNRGAVLKLNSGFSAASFSFPEGEARGVPPLHTKKSGQELCRHVQSSLALTEKPAPGGGNAVLCRPGCLYNS